MKKTKIFLTFILAFSLGVLATIGVYIYTAGDVDWLTYIKAELLPSAVLALTSISAICIALLPTVNAVRSSVSGFNQATKDVNSTDSTAKSILEEIKDVKGEVLSAISDLKDVKNSVASSIEPVKKAAENVEEIVRIGFCENEDLVKRGIAARIAKVGTDYGE